MKKKRSYLNVFFLIMFLSIFLFGCKHDTIEFRRESSVSKMFNNIENRNDKPMVKSGIIILRDDTQETNVNFGPKDINFGLPAKF